VCIVEGNKKNSVYCRGHLRKKYRKRLKQESANRRKEKAKYKEAEKGKTERETTT
jgi:hypothetical protein